MVDIAAKKAEGKGKGCGKWTALHNLKQMAATMSIYEESGFSSPEKLEAALAAASAGLQETYHFRICRPVFQGKGYRGEFQKSQSTGKNGTP